MPPRLMDGAFSMDRHTSNGKVSSNLLENLDASHRFLQLASLLGQRILRSEVPRTSIVNKNHFFPVTPVFKGLWGWQWAFIICLGQLGQRYKLRLTNSFSSSQYNFVAEVDSVKFAVSFCVYLQQFRVYNQVLSSFLSGLYLCSIYGSP